VTEQHLNSTATYHLPLTESRLPENMTKDPLSEFFLNKRTRIYARGLQGTYPHKRFLVFFDDQNPRPSNFLSQIARGSGATLSECTFSSKKRTSLRRFLQEKTTSRLLFERTRTRLVSPSEAREIRRLSSSTMKCSRACRCGTDRVPQRCDYKSWALAWSMNRSKKGCNNCYTESK
jgi:hypothetical protein